MWTLGVLPAGVENVVELGRGTASTTAAAEAAAVDALLDAVSTGGRQEYRLTIGGGEVLVLPGLTEQGDVEIAGLPDAVRRVRAGS